MIIHKIRSTSKRIVKHTPFWQLFKMYSRLIDFLFAHKNLLEKELRFTEEKKLADTLFRDLVVIEGPFKGLQYPALKSHGSAIFAKLYGTYEFSISDLFTSENLKKYGHVIDIGCAEGYYAIGVCLLNDKLTVTAVDTSLEALRLCKQMAEKNGVSDRISFSSAFEWHILKEIAKNNKKNVLIICDCEGCEAEIFNRNMPPEISNCDLVIELHDFINPIISKILLENFSKTHNVRIVKEDRKARFPQLRRLSRFQRELILDEQRPTLMEWMILTKNI